MMKKMSKLLSIICVWKKTIFKKSKGVDKDEN